MRQNKQSQLLNIPERAHIFLDTNVLIDSLKHPDEFSVLHQAFQEKNLAVVMDSTVRFELLRKFRSNKKAKQFLKEIIADDLPDVPEVRAWALKIARVCHYVENKDLAFADALIGGQIAKYAREKLAKTSVILATQNHKDFPPILFDRVDEQIITLRDGSIKVVGFYVFNKAKYQNLTEKLYLDD